MDTDKTAGNRKGRPNYPADFKRRLAIEACAPGISVSKLAQQNGINANMLFKWRRELRTGLFEPAASVLLPVLVKPAMTRSPSLPPAESSVSVKPAPAQAGLANQDHQTADRQRLAIHRPLHNKGQEA